MARGKRRWFLPVICAVVAAAAAAVLLLWRSGGGAPSLRDRYDLTGVVKLTYQDIDAVCEDAALTDYGAALLRAMEQRDAVLLSFAVDSSIQLEDRLGRYDHLVVVNPLWIERFDSMDHLTPIRYEDLPEALRGFLTDQLPGWTADKSVCPAGIRYYEYQGDGLLTFPFGAGTLAPAFQAENPLVLMIDEPAQTMQAASFLLPLSSSGNLLFTEEEALENRLEASGLENYVSAIEPVVLE